jgi:hypothetical protein
MRELVTPEFAINVTDVVDEKADLLALHKSQADWLDATQGMGSYVDTMRQLGDEVGQICGREVVAEGWRRHLHIGLSSENFDPLRDALAEYVVDVN